MPAELRPNRLSIALSAQRAAGVPLIDLTESNPTRVGLPELARAELLGPLADPAGLCYQPSPQGLLVAREAISCYYRARGLPVSPDHLVLCASTSEAYAWLFQLLCDEGDEVLHPQPSYPLLGHLAALCAVRLRPYPLHYEGRWVVDVAALRAACGPRTRAVVVVSPNNPTGSCLRQEELVELSGLCAERGLCLIADEVFGDYRLASGQDGLVGSLVGASVPCFVLSGLSKVLGLPQLKLAWIHVGGPEPWRSAAQERLELLADMFLSVGTPVQLAAPELLRQQPQLGGAIASRVHGNRARLASLVAGSTCQLLRADGGWQAVLRLPRL
ncbi:MAG: pyridoxal phosphate-dependent aminotransferase, partial [Myxococcota bacterium]|nr:pyridoxal phosphate-dependent aminotransferase [Myxococcota bacterium]